MRRARAERRILLGIAAGVLALAVTVLLALAATRLMWDETTVAYPGAALTAQHRREQFFPSLWLRRDTSYRTAAPFNDIYTYYSSGLDLGPQQRASGGCILMTRSDTTARIISQAMSVTLCDTPEGRLIYVMRSISIRLR